MFCLNCGKEVSDDSNFCINCGCRLDKNSMFEHSAADKKPAIDISSFSHPSDIKALNALKSIPGFSAVTKAFFKFYNERQFYIQNMSSNLRLSSEQLPEYYNMLPPICEKLGIAVPELYLSLDVVPNAYTSGDNNPFIVVTSGLIDSMPKELIPTVLAHECGHIACHHTLYHTMGNMILNGTLLAMDSFGLSKLISIPLQVAFFYWMRCSEYSADRASVLYNGSAENLIEMCMRFSGYKGENITVRNKELFIQQAIGYNDYVSQSGWNKTLEFAILKDCTHPFNSVRAFEANNWTSTQQFSDAMKLINY